MESVKRPAPPMHIMLNLLNFCRCCQLSFVEDPCDDDGQN